MDAGETAENRVDRRILGLVIPDIELNHLVCGNVGIVCDRHTGTITVGGEL